MESSGRTWEAGTGILLHLTDGEIEAQYPLGPNFESTKVYRTLPFTF